VQVLGCFRSEEKSLDTFLRGHQRTAEERAGRLLGRTACHNVQTKVINPIDRPLNQRIWICDDDSRMRHDNQSRDIFCIDAGHASSAAGLF
jgi:hypothetical protein